MSAPTVGLTAVRCAIYTRTSTDDRLDQTFNSLDAQREACEAYVGSQRREGWQLLPERYDDGGHSGGTLDRPALQRLLRDLSDGKVDVVIIYKIDRLTRALSDFSRIVDALDNVSASFVSVTQSFNTTTSMGRLTLNMLLSFAQFERELGSERVRDKIAASKRKGMWMGGVCPIGYDVQDRALVINGTEALTVRLIFDLYLTLGSVPALQSELNNRGVRSKMRSHRDGRTSGDQPIGRGALYQLLRNPIYIGRTPHRGETFPGLHEGIVDEAIFERATGLLDNNRRWKSGNRTASSALLAGKLWDEHGRPMPPTQTAKGTKRYHYYASRNPDSLDELNRVVRISAWDVELLVADRLGAFLSDGESIYDAFGSGLEPKQLPALITCAEVLAEKLNCSDENVRRSVLQTIVHKVIVHPEHIALGLAACEFGPVRDQSIGLKEDLHWLSIPCQLFRRTREIRLISPSQSQWSSKQDPGLIRLLVRAREARRAFEAGRGKSLREVAAAERKDPDYFSVLVKLSYLAPDIVSDILQGKQPPSLSRQKLARIRALPQIWSEQRWLLGFGARSGLISDHN